MTYLRATFILLLNIPLWLAYAAVSVVLGLIGIPLVTLAALGRQWEFMPSRVWPDRVIRRWWHLAAWMNAIFGNEQDGIDGLPQNYPPSNPAWPDRKFRDLAARVIVWSAFRNATNNLRFLHHFTPRLRWLNPNTIEPSRVRFIGNPQAKTSPNRFSGWLCWQGVYAGAQVWLRTKTGRTGFWIGWKVRPEHADPSWWPEDPCWKGVGFTAGRKAT